MADRERTRGELAGEFRTIAVDVIARIDERYDGGKMPMEVAVGFAQAAATIALGERVAELTEGLADHLGDDSNLDRLQGGRERTMRRPRVVLWGARRLEVQLGGENDFGRLTVFKNGVIG